MSRSILVALGCGALHLVVVAAYAWPNLSMAGLDLVLLSLGATGAIAPTPTRIQRHRDVIEAERTPLGRRLLYRDFWRVSSVPVALALLAVVWAAAAASFLAVGPRPPYRVEAVVIWTPVVLFAVGAVAAQMVNMWAALVPLLALWLVFLAGASFNGEGLIALQVLGVGVGVVASIFASDLLKTLTSGRGHSA